MLYIPPEIRETWPEPNYDNPHTRGPGLLVFVLTFHIVATTMVALRWYTRSRITLSFGMDDIFILVAMIPTTGLAASVLVANIKYGWDRHIWDLEPDKFTPGIQLSMACGILYAVSSAFIKLSLLAFYKRLLLPDTSRIYTWVIWIVGFATGASGVIFTFQLIFLCKPIHAYWDFRPPLYRPPYEYHCGNRFGVNFISSVVNTALEFIVMLIPIPLAWRLRLPMRQRLVVIAVFGLGMIAIAASALKAKFIVESMGLSYDEQWDAYPLWIMVIVEVDVSIICVSVPALRPLISRYLPKAFGTGSHRRSGQPSARFTFASAEPRTLRSTYMSGVTSHSTRSQLKSPVTAKVYPALHIEEADEPPHSPPLANESRFVGIARTTERPISEADSGSISSVDRAKMDASESHYYPISPRSNQNAQTEADEPFSFINDPSNVNSMRNSWDEAGPLPEHGVYRMEAWRQVRARADEEWGQRSPPFSSYSPSERNRWSNEDDEKLSH